MSLAALASSLRSNTPPRPAAAPKNDPAAPPAPLGPGAAPQPKPEGSFGLLTRYIPTETVTLYVAAVATLSQLAKDKSDWGVGPALATYLGFVAVTPLLLWLLAFAEHRKADIIEPFRLPWWPMLAATIAFLVWGLSIPGNPLGANAGGLPALGAMIVSTLLSILDPIFLKPDQSPAP